MNSEQLRHFIAIAECKNITKAAEKLFVSQPALSMSLSKLEAEVGCPLFIRDGRSIIITKEGQVLLEYAYTVVHAIEQAKNYFRSMKNPRNINLYRIGGTSIRLLTEGCYDIEKYQLHTMIVKSSDLPKIASSGIACVIIADDRSMNISTNTSLERIPLYNQSLLLSVDKDDPLFSTRNEIPVTELHAISLMGRANPVGFNDWLNEVKKENQCDFTHGITIDNSTYFAERNRLSIPYLIGSFGIGTTGGKEYFPNRKLIPVKGVYTEREICLYYNRRLRKEIHGLIDKITENASKMNILDRQVFQA